MDIPQGFFEILLVQILLFLGLWMVLKRVWFDPALRVIAAREKRSHGAVAEAKVVQDEAERLRREHAAAMEQAKTEAQREVDEMLRQAEAEQRRIVGEANDEAQRTAAETRARVADEIAAARKGLDAHVHAIAREVERVVLGRAV